MFLSSLKTESGKFHSSLQRPPSTRILLLSFKLRAMSLRVFFSCYTGFTNLFKLSPSKCLDQSFLKLSLFITREGLLPPRIVLLRFAVIAPLYLRIRTP